ncbi:MAG: hypothetical protein ABII82_18510 [Verrucomicrobiota bacterium]
MLLFGVMPVFLLSPIAAQTAAAPPPPAVFRLLALTPVADLLYDLQGKPVAVVPGQHSYSPPYRVTASGSVAFYRLIPSATPGEPPVRVPVVAARVTADAGVSTLILLLPEGPPVEPDPGAPPRPLKSLVIDDSAAAHPAGTIRVFSFSLRPVLVKIGTRTVQITTGEPALIPYPPDTRTWVQVATTGEGGWQRVIGTPQMLAPDTRLALYLSDLAPSLNDPNPVGLSLRKIIERMPPAAP